MSALTNTNAPSAVLADITNAPSTILVEIPKVFSATSKLADSTPSPAGSKPADNAAVVVASGAVDDKTAAATREGHTAIPSPDHCRALIIIDVQNDFLHPKGNFPCPDSSTIPLTANLKALIPRFRAAGGAIIWVQAQYIDRNEDTAGMKANPKGSNEWLTHATHVFETSCCLPGSFGAELYAPIAKLMQPEDALVHKVGYSAFWETDALKDVLREKKVTQAFFAGLASNTCVSATIIDAVKLGGMQTYAVLDCMGWRRHATHEEAIERLKKLEVVALINSGEI